MGIGNEGGHQMALTAHPITARTCSMDDRSPIGTRYADGDELYTLVAYDMSPFNPRQALPMFVWDDDLDAEATEFDTLSRGSIEVSYAREIIDGDEELVPAPASPETSDRARAAAVARYQESYRNTGDSQRVLAFEDLTTQEEVDAFHRWAKADLALCDAQYALERAAKKRAYTLRTIVNLRGSQTKGAAALGMNQSSVSRALRMVPDIP